MTIEVSREREFVDYLLSLQQSEDREALAKLRRSLKRPPAEARDVWRYLVPRIREEWRRDDYFLVAGLFATHPCSSGDSLGVVFRRLDPERKHDSTEKRFLALLSAKRADLPHHLAAVIQLARAREIPVDYERLLRDLRHWEHADRFVQYRWAQDYWGRGDSNGFSELEGE